MPVKPHPQLLVSMSETPLLMRTTAGATRDIPFANILGIKVLPDEYTQSFTCVTIVALKSFVLYNVYIGLLRPVRDSIKRWWASAAGLAGRISKPWLQYVGFLQIVHVALPCSLSFERLVADVDILLCLLPNLSLFYSSTRISKCRRTL